MQRDHRRFLALFLALFGMALAASGAHAGSLCAGGVPGSFGSILCERLAPLDSLPPGIDTGSLYDVSDPVVGVAGGTILLGGQDPAAESARSSGLLLDLAWSPAQGDDATVASAR